MLQGFGSKLLGYSQLFRVHNGLLGGVACLIGVISGGGPAVSQLQWVVAFTVVFLFLCGGNAVNDYYDIESDRVNKPWRPLPSGKLRPGEALKASTTCFFLGLCLAVLLGIYPFIIALSAATLLLLYAKTVKRKGFLGNLVISLLTMLTFVFGGVITPNPVAPFFLGILAFSATLGRELVKGLEDVAGDKAVGVSTVAITLGPSKTAFFSAVYFLLAVLLAPMPYAAGIYGSTYIILVSIPIAIFSFSSAYILYKRTPTAAARIATLTKYGIASGLLAFLVGSLS